MTSPRRHISLTTKLAAALLTIRRPNENGELVPVISFEEAQKLTDAEIIAKYHFDHYPIPHALGGPDRAWNLQPLPKDTHGEKTAKIDIPRIAKAKRIGKAEEEFRRRLLAKREPVSDEIGTKRKPKATIPSRPFQKRQKKSRDVTRSQRA